MGTPIEKKQIIYFLTNFYQILGLLKGSFKVTLLHIPAFLFDNDFCQPLFEKYNVTLAYSTCKIKKRGESINI